MNRKTAWSGLRISILVVAVVSAIAAALYWQRGQIAVAVIKRQIPAIAGNSDPLSTLPDGLHVGLCGAGSPFPDARRSGPCTVVVAGKRLFVFDSGSGAARNIARMQLNAGQIDALFFTHYHSDHIDGLGELMLQRWIQRKSSEPLPIYGPQGLDPVLEGFHQAYKSDAGWRTGHHGAIIAPPDGFGGTAKVFNVPAQTGRIVLIAEPDLEIVAFLVDHRPIEPAVGYRIRYKDRTAVISGDTKKSDAVAREAKGVDLLLHEALSPSLLGLLEKGYADAGRKNIAQILHDVLNYHTTPEQAAAIAQASGVKMLVMNHIVPPLPSKALEPAFLEGSDQIYRGPIKIGEDMDWFSLPAGTVQIQSSQRVQF